MVGIAKHARRGLGLSFAAENARAERGAIQAIDVEPGDLAHDVIPGREHHLDRHNRAIPRVWDRVVVKRTRR